MHPRRGAPCSHPIGITLGATVSVGGWLSVNVAATEVAWLTAAKKNFGTPRPYRRPSAANINRPDDIRAAAPICATHLPGRASAGRLPTVTIGMVAARQTGSAAGNLPASLSSFVGRTTEIYELAELLERCRLLTLTGAPGIGKSRLALEATGQLGERYPDGAWLVELAPIGDEALLPRALASALSVPEVPGASLTDAILARLKKCRALLVLDNCEHLVTGCAKLVDSLLSGCPHLSIVATSREPLTLLGEKVWQVPALAVPPADAALTPETLIEYEAARLFAERAGAVQLGFELTAEHVRPIAEIARRLDGIPLAIELAAARVEILTPAEIAVRLDQRFALLTNGSRGHLSRHQSLEAALDWSHDLLCEPERALLRRLSVFRGGFCLEACEVVCAGGAIEDEEVFRLLARLVAKSLVRANTANSRGRYRLLETIRAYATDRLEESGDAASTGAAHARFYLRLAEQAEPELTGPSQARWFERLDGEHANLRAAFGWSREHAHADWALRMGGALILFWRVRCRFSEGRELLEAALAEGEAESHALRTKARWGAGFLAFMAGDPEGARPALEESLAGSRELADPTGAARALLVIGHTNYYYYELPEQLALLEESATLARDAGDQWCLAHALGAAGYAHLGRGDFPAARPLFEQGLAVAREADDKQGLRYGLNGLGWVAVGQGAFGSAGPLFDETLTIARELGEDLFEASALSGLGQLAFGRGDHGRARELLEEARDVLPAASPFGQVLGPLLYLGRVAHAQGDLRRAQELFSEAESHLPPGYSSFPLFQWAGELAVDVGNRDAARRFFEQALEGARAGGLRALTARALHGLGRLARGRDELKRAAALHDEALGLQRELEEAPGIAASLEAIGGLAGEAGRLEHAARLLGAANALRERIGCARLPWESARYDADLALGHEELGADAFRTAFAQGARMSIEEAVAQASKGRKRQAGPSTGWSGLTETERQVTALAADGLTNPQIAERLFVTLATVKTHLRHIFLKLGVATRRELEGEVRRHLPKAPPSDRA